jgi:hypothetical protein
MTTLSKKNGRDPLNTLKTKSSSRNLRQGAASFAQVRLYFWGEGIFIVNPQVLL